MNKYQKYLKTAAWRRRRARKLRQQPRCKFHRLGDCGGGLDVHHRTYERLGREKMSDLEVMCRKHHDLWHELKDVNKWMTKKYGKNWRKKWKLSTVIRIYRAR